MGIFTRARPRGVRPEIPAATPGSSIYPTGAQWGAIELPNPSTTTVMGLPAASRARDLISGAVAQMAPLEMWTPDGYIADTAPTIITRPNSVWTCFDFFDMAVAQAIMHGNMLGLLADFDATGYPQQIVPVAHGFWFAYIDGAGYTVYSINGDLYSRDEVFHVRVNAGPNQPMGVGVVAQFRRALGAALDQQNYSADTYRSGSVPAGLIKVGLPEVDPTQADAVTEQWIANHAGGRAPAFLPNTMDFVPLSWSPEAMDFLNARQFTVAEVAFMFNLDPTDLSAAMAGDSQTYANIEQRQQQRITDSYAPWMLRFEQEFSDLLPGGNTARFCADRLLRTDSTTRAKVHETNIATRVETVDEARKSEGKRPLPANVTPLPLPAPVPDDPNIEVKPVSEAA